jgi:glycosyltransferase
MPPHPTFFVKKKIYEKYGYFNLKLGSAADYEIMLRFMLKHRISSMYIPQVLIKMRAGGVSNKSWKNRFLANKYDRLSWKLNEIRPYPWTLFLKPVRKLHQYLLPYIKKDY